MTSIDRASRANWRLGVIAAVAVLALVGVVIFGIREINDNRTHISSEQQSTATLTAVVDAVRAEVQCQNGYQTALAMDQSMVNAIETSGNRPSSVHRAYAAYRKKHPAPKPGACGLDLKLPPRSHGTPTAKPPKTVTRTVQVPGPTITQPGRTVTVTAPPGKGHRR